MVETFDMLEGN